MVRRILERPRGRARGARSLDPREGAVLAVYDDVRPGARFERDGFTDYGAWLEGGDGHRGRGAAVAVHRPGYLEDESGEGWGPLSHVPSVWCDAASPDFAVAPVRWWRLPQALRVFAGDPDGRPVPTGIGLPAASLVPSVGAALVIFDSGAPDAPEAYRLWADGGDGHRGAGACVVVFARAGEALDLDGLPPRMPGWWFDANSDAEVPVNPVRWWPLPTLARKAALGRLAAAEAALARARR